MLLITYYAYRRFAAVRRATVLVSASAAVLLVAEFILAGAPTIIAQPALADTMVVFEGRYSNDPQLLLMQRTPLDFDPFIEL